MLTLFIEYKVNPEMRKEYLAYMEKISDEMENKGCRLYRYLEGVDQPNLFVETCDVKTEADYKVIKEWRSQDEVMATYVVGGQGKIHVWAFEEVEE